MRSPIFIAALGAGAALSQARWIADRSSTTRIHDWRQLPGTPWSHVNSTQISQAHAANASDLGHSPHSGNATGLHFQIYQAFSFLQHDKHKTSRLVRALGDSLEEVGIGRLDPFLRELKHELPHPLPSSNGTSNGDNHASTLKLLGFYGAVLTAVKERAVSELILEHEKNGAAEVAAQSIPATCNEYCGVHCIAANIIPIFGYLDCLKKCHADTECTT